MVYKILILEAIAVCGMLYLRFEPRVEFGDAPETTVAIPSPTPTSAKEETKTSPVKARPEPVSPLPRNRVTVVDEPLVFPVAGHGPEHVISVFGDKRGKSRLHQGIDIKAPRGTDVVATTDGFVEKVKHGGGSGGKCVYLRDGTGRLFYYAHLDEIGVEEFTAVKAGDVLGTVGDTGNAKGTTPHLHFEILLGKERKAVDPMGFWTGA